MPGKVTSDDEDFNFEKIVLKPEWEVDVGNYVTSLAYSPDGSVIGGTQSDGVVFWVQDKGTDSICIRTHKNGALCSSWSSDGKYFASCRSGRKDRYLEYRVKKALWPRLMEGPLGWSTWRGIPQGRFWPLLLVNSSVCSTRKANYCVR